MSKPSPIILCLTAITIIDLILASGIIGLILWILYGLYKLESA